VNGDLLPGAALPTNNCQRPDCMNQFARLYVTGYVDYAYDCINGTWQASWMLDHECDGIHHAPGTARPAPANRPPPDEVLHGRRPRRGLHRLADGPNQSNGTITQQALRKNNWATSPQICHVRGSLHGTFQAGATICLCVPTGLASVRQTSVNAAGAAAAPSPRARTGVRAEADRPLDERGRLPRQPVLLFDFGWLSTQDGCTGRDRRSGTRASRRSAGTSPTTSRPAAREPVRGLASANLSATSPAPRIGAPHVAYWLLNFNL
jgi:hypothetical protein